MQKPKLKTLPKPQRRLSSYTATELREKYPAEYNSWRNGKSRAKENWAPEFEAFIDFLTHVGPMPGRGYTLDRINNDDPRYGPGLCRWADKKEQAANRSTTHQLVTGAGDPQPLPEVARALKMSPRALRSSLKREGGLAYGADPRKYRPWPRSEDGSRELLWEELYLRSGQAQYMTRFEFYEMELRSKIAFALQYLENNFDPGVDKQDPKVEEQLKILNNGRDWLAKAQMERPAWEEAMQRHESILIDKNKARRRHYNFDDDLD